MLNLTYRQAKAKDLPAIVELLTDDYTTSDAKPAMNAMAKNYQAAFDVITADRNHYLMVVLHDDLIVGTCHLMLLPSLTFDGHLQLQIEAVRVAKDFRRRGVGKYMMQQVVAYGKAHNAKLIQLTSNKTRSKAVNFYRSIGFRASYEGMKLFL